MTRFELVTSSLPRKCSTPELHQQNKKRAGDEVRTRDIQLGRLTLYQLSYSRNTYEKIVGRTGFEPVKVKPADLQSALVGRLSISPRNFKLLKYVLYFEPAEGFEPTTPRLQITCSGQLSYAGVFVLQSAKV